MLEAALVFGAIIALGIALILIKLPTRVALKLLGRAMLLDIAVTIFTLWIHWGTMTGLMAAAVAGMICSVVTSVARRAFGYIRKGVYHPGYLNLLVKS